jgi:hypothetical protein
MQARIFRRGLAPEGGKQIPGLGARLARAHEAPFVPPLGTDEPVPLGVEQPDIAGLPRQQLQLVDQAPPLVIEHHDAAYQAMVVGHGHGEADGRLDGQLDGAVLDVQIEGRDVDLAGGQPLRFLEVVALALVAQLARRPDPRFAFGMVHAHLFPAVQANEPDLVVDPLLPGQAEVFEAQAATVFGIGLLQAGSERVVLGQVAQVRQHRVEFLVDDLRRHLDDALLVGLAQAQEIAGVGPLLDGDRRCQQRGEHHAEQQGLQQRAAQVDPRHPVQAVGRGQVDAGGFHAREISPVDRPWAARKRMVKRDSRGGGVSASPASCPSCRASSWPCRPSPALRPPIAHGTGFS